MFETCYKYPQCTVFVTCFVYLLLFTLSIDAHCDFLSCLSTGYPDLVVQKSSYPDQIDPVRCGFKNLAQK